ncbi:MAG: DUF371 domain-containing protein [Candidatus Methanomethylicus sp.]|nr:DUF371 domain-containing protein [Candidatus Methanomethylicus sp.]
MVEFAFLAMGSVRITATHATTLEITKEDVKTTMGHCIVATQSEVGLSDLPLELKRLLRTDGSKIALTIKVGGVNDTIQGYGHHDLPLTSTFEMVARKSSFICGRTLMIGANKAACDLKRELVSALRKQDSHAIITISVQEVSELPH